MSDVKQNTLRNNFLVKFSIWIIKNFYRKYIKPYLKKKKNVLCSFYPDCSEYGILALQKYGFFKGWYKSINRMLRCTTYKHKKSCVDYP